MIGGEMSATAALDAFGVRAGEILGGLRERGEWKKLQTIEEIGRAHV